MKRTDEQGSALRFGLVGCGRIAETYARAFEVCPNATLVAVSDINQDAATALAAQAGCRSWPSYRELAESEAIDAVVIATPPAFHGEIALAFLRCGMPVLCEKPVSLTVETAREIRRAALDHRTLFTMASKFRYAEDIVRARSLVESGILGDIVLFENTFMSFVDMSRRWNADRAVSGGGVLIDNGTHSVDIMRYFIGPLAMIHAVEGPSIQRLPVDETVHVSARAAQGAMGRMDLSWSISKQTDDYVCIYGSKGTLRVGWKASSYRRTSESEWVQFGRGYDKIQAFRDQITNFSAAIQGAQALVIDADDAIASVEAIQSAYDSMARDSWTRVPNDGATIRNAVAAA